MEKMFFEDSNGVMVPGSTVLREVHHVFHYGTTETVSELFADEWDGVTGPINEALCLEPIDNDPTIEVALAAYGL